VRSPYCCSLTQERRPLSTQHASMRAL
jgi:hypothetical protein